MKRNDSHSAISDLLRKYRMGNLTAAEEQHLHAAAREDPFIADAMEGMDKVGGEEFGASVDRLKERLESLVAPSTRITSVGLWVRIAGAAALVLIVAGIWWFWQPQSNQPVTQFIESRDHVKDESVNRESRPSLDQGPGKSADSPAVTNEPEPQEYKSSAVTEEGPMQQKPEQDIELNPDDDILIGQKEISEHQLSAGEPAVPDESPLSDLATDRQARQQHVEKATIAPLGATEDITTLQISGIITDTTGTPIGGANIVQKGTSNEVATDASGKFILPVENHNEDATIVVSYPGYQTLEQQSRPGDFLDIQLSDGASPDEVAVTAYDKNTQRPGQQRTRALAQPVDGMRLYKRYLQSNLKYPEAAAKNDIHGDVVLEFDLSSEGRPLEIRVIESLGYGCDEEAIRLLKEGPDWDIDSAQVPIGQLTVTF